MITPAVWYQERTITPMIYVRSAANSLVTHIFSSLNDEYPYPTRTMSPVAIKPAIFQRCHPERMMSSQVSIPQRSARSAYDLMPPKPLAPPGLVPPHGISRSVPISAPSAVARRRLKNKDCSIKRINN